MIVEYSTRFPFVSEIEVGGGEGEWRKPLEKSRYSDVARFTIRLLPGVSRSKANKTLFIALARGEGRGGGEGSFFDVYEALRCKARGNNRRGVATCSNPRSKWWRSFLFMGTCERFDVATFAIVEKKGMEEEIYVRHFVGDPVELLWVENDT